MDGTENDVKYNVESSASATLLQNQSDFYTISLPNLEHVENLSNVCRICATMEDLVIPIFEGEGLKHELAEKINQYLPIQVQVDEEMPMNVCVKCAHSILTWHSMYTRCTLAEHALRARLLHLHAKAQKAKRLLLNKQKAETQTATSSDPHIKKPFNLDVDIENVILALQTDENNIERVTNESTKKPAEIVTSPDGKRYASCHVCSKLIPTRTWSRHARSHASDAICPHCDQRFAHRTNLARHVKAIHFNHKPHVCHVCSKSFTRKSHLEDHAKSHSDRRDFVCEVCGKRSKSGGALRMHSLTHGERQLPCSVCGAAFKSARELTAHGTVHVAKGFSCHCGKRFRLHSQLHSHCAFHPHTPR